ncbi:MAG TPA: cytochrome b/b6 domain-containing protein [Povalibacter sp.]|uniref:cytochrome b/b6 domain-containing protein n=1 Tax=Povalibacter sp. TaxID=1962978 RepID=UPI002C6B2C93|nr:cytochrome b/b6 domain-containing protein [Povalibacter sp.]HMN45475.1 cytochrome b/b6 domain-containing protein [Povalibacter sp.]
MPDSPLTRVRIWDAPIRLVHWLMVALVALSWWTAENNNLEWHRYSGYALLGLLVFRVYWGFFGSETARFANFVKGPRAVWSYVRDASGAARPGHNPLGALSVILLLLLLIAQVTLGLFAVDVDGIESGPLSHLVSFDTGRACADIHETLFNVLLGLIGLHIIAVLYYLLFRRQNLIATMIHGKRDVPAGTTTSLASLSWPKLLIGLVLAGIVVWYISRG